MTKDIKGKVRLSLLPYSALAKAVKVREFGINKYGDVDGYKKVEEKEWVEAIARHALKYLEGERVDEESGLEHIAHIACGAILALVDKPTNVLMGVQKQMSPITASETLRNKDDIELEGKIILNILTKADLDGIIHEEMFGDVDKVKINLDKEDKKCNTITMSSKVKELMKKEENKGGISYD